MMTIVCAGLVGCSSVKKQPLTSGIDLANLDTTVAAGNDFYQYACGGWLKNHPLTPEYSRYGSFTILAENNSKKVKELIAVLSATPQAKGSNAQKIGDLYNLVMDSVRLNKEGYAPIQADLARIAAVKKRSDLLPLMVDLSKDGISSFLGYYVDADMMDSNANLFQFYQSGLSLPNKSYYLDEKESMQTIRTAFKAYMVTLFEKIGYSSKEATKRMKAAYGIEHRLAKAYRSPAELRDVSANYNKRTLAELKKEYAALNWDQFFQGLGLTPAQVPAVSISQPEALKEAVAILSTAPVADQVAYLQWHLINASAGSLSDDFSAESFNFYGKTLSGSTAQRPRWKRAVSTVDALLGMAMGEIYVEKYFPAAAKERMIHLVKNLQGALTQRIAAQTWMNDSTKAKAVEKLQAFHLKVGYPDVWKDYNALTIDPALSLWANKKAASRFETAYELAEKVGKPVNKDLWLMNPHQVNAYYNPTTNEICFPAGILQPPFFDMAADDAYNYGAIGVVIGHEMTHGFDDQGSQFDKKGDFNNWWTADDSKSFKERTQVMIDFFDQIEVLPGLKANGSLTVGENIADHGGMQISYQAFLNATKDAPLGVKQGFTADQRFFLAYAGLWANNIREKQMRVYTATDPHSLGKWRVNGALPHIDAWYKAFNITPEDSLFVPKAERVDMW